MPLTPVYGWPTQALTDAPSGPAGQEALALAVEDDVARIDGQLAHITVQYRASGAVSTTSATYETRSGDPGGSFVAPSTGRVLVVISSAMDNDDASTGGRATFQVREGGSVGSGTIVHVASNDDSISLVGTGNAEFGKTSLVSGLVAGNTYNVQMLYLRDAGAGTASFARRSVLILRA
jgi:hypothetical protein